MMVLGLTGMFVGQLLYLLGIYLTNTNMACVFQLAVPVWSTFLAMISGVEPPPKLARSHGVAKILGMLLAATGAVTMTLGKWRSNSREESWLVSGTSVGSQFLGCICLLSQTSATAVYNIIQKKYIFNQPHSTWKTQPMAVTAWSYFFGAIFMALASLTYVNQPEKFTSFSMEAFYCLVYAILITSSMCYLLLSWCNMQVPSTMVTASWPLQALFCAVLSFIFLGESLQLLECCGGGFIVCGLVAVLWSNFKEEKESNVPNNEKDTRDATYHNLNWKFSEAMSQGYVVVPKDDD